MADMYREFNPNPKGLSAGDCVIRAVSALTGIAWEEVYIMLAVYGLKMCDMPSANRVWGRFLRDHGFKRYALSDSCPDCYTVRDFCKDHQNGRYIVATGTHVVAVMDGRYYDAWDSGYEVPAYYWRKNV